MKFNPKKVAFGRHETFPLRYGWLSKGFQAFKKDPTVFSSEDATVILGVGKNMVSSIRYWLQACQVIEMEKNNYKPTLLGEAVFGGNGYDPYLEDEATIWLIHWLLASNPEYATTFYWFFNRFHKPEFSGNELADALQMFLREKIETKQPAITTLKQDITILLRMYIQSKGSTRTPLEDALDSPLSTLKLISYAPALRICSCKSSSRDKLAISIIGFAIAEIFKHINSRVISIEELMYRKDDMPSLGSVFGLSENGLLTKIEKLTSQYPNFYELRESAGIHQLYELANVEPIFFLEQHYKKERLKVVA